MNDRSWQGNGEQAERSGPSGRPVSDLQRLSTEEQTNVILKFIPEDQPSPRAWLELIKAQVMGVDARGNTRPVEDLIFFLHACRRTNLDPLARQIYAVYRWDSRQGRERMTVQVSIDGMRLTAHRSGLYGGQDDAVFTPEDESAEHPTKATVTVYRINPHTGDRMPVTASARWSEYVPVGRDGNPTGLWSRMPYLMLAKVAEALALRKAFPQELSGLYASEEMDQDDSAVRAEPVRAQAQLEAAEQKRAPAQDAQADRRRAPAGGNGQAQVERKQPANANVPEKNVPEKTAAA